MFGEFRRSKGQKNAGPIRVGAAKVERLGRLSRWKKKKHRATPVPDF